MLYMFCIPYKIFIDTVVSVIMKYKVGTFDS